MTFKRQYILYWFIPVCILYYFLRFQFNVDALVLLVYAVLQVLIFSFGFSCFLSNLRLNKLDYIVLLGSVHALYLLTFTFIKTPTSDTLLYSLKDYIFPISVYWFCRRISSEASWNKIWNIIIASFVVVAVIYNFEFFHRFIFNLGPFHYTDKVSELLLSKTGRDSLGWSVNKGDLYTLVRFGGPLSHNNVTGLAISLGGILSLLKYQFLPPSRLKSLTFVLSIICLLGAALCGARTAIFSAISAYLVFRIWYMPFKFKLTQTVLFKSVSLLFVLTPIFVYSFDVTAFSAIYNFERLFGTLVYLLTDRHEYVELILQFSNPLTIFGVGYPVPGVYQEYLSLIRSDDIFFTQLISMYGIIILVIPWSFVIIFKKKFFDFSFRDCSTISPLSFSLSVVTIIAFLLSTIHTNSLIRPQLFPIFFIALSCISYVMDNYYSSLVIQESNA